MHSKRKGDVAGELDAVEEAQEGVHRQAFVMSATYKVKKLGGQKKDEDIADKAGERDKKGWEERPERKGGDLNMVKMARKLLKMAGKPRVIDVSDGSRAVSSRVKQLLVRCPRDLKDAYLLFFLLHNTGRTIVFINHISVLRRVHAIVASLLGRHPWPRAH